MNTARNRVIWRCRLASWCALLVLVCLPSAARAFDVGAIIERNRLATFAVAPGERLLAAGMPAPDRPALGVSVVGHRWGYLSRYETPQARTARHGPFPFARCGAPNGRVILLAFGTDAHALTFDDCPDGVAPLWLVLPEGDVVALHPREPSKLTRWAGTTDDATLVAAIARRWQQRAPVDARYQPVPQPAGFEIAARPGFDLRTVPARHRAALDAWRNTRPARARAGAALAALGTAVSEVDWFAPAAQPAAIVNDVAFFLQQTGARADATDAALLLDAVLRADPGRVPARLNLGDAWSQVAACDRSARASRRAAEQYRHYCAAMGPARIPGAIARRIATALEVTRLDAEACRPRWRIFDLVAAGDGDGLSALLAEHPEDVDARDADDERPLTRAIRRGDRDIVRRLLDAGADARQPSAGSGGHVPLVLAAWAMDPEIVRLLLAHRRADPNPIGVRVLPLGAAAGIARQAPDAAVAMIGLLMDAGAYVDAPAGDDRRTALMEAAGAAAPRAVIDALLRRGAVVNRIDRYGRNALLAVPPFDPRAVDTVRALLDAGANPHQQDQDGRNALNRLFAWGGRDRDVVRAMAAALVDGGAEPWTPDNEGYSGLFRAAANTDPDLVALLHAVPRPPAVAPGKDPVSHIRERLRAAETNPPRDCTCVADWQRILTILQTP